jgi:hypothetical protein
MSKEFGFWYSAEVLCNGWHYEFDIQLQLSGRPFALTAGRELTRSWINLLLMCGLLFSTSSPLHKPHFHSLKGHHFVWESNCMNFCSNSWNPWNYIPKRADLLTATTILNCVHSFFLYFWWMAGYHLTRITVFENCFSQFSSKKYNFYLIS